MQPIQIDHAGDSRLRVIFSDTVMSVGLAANATFEDVARRLDEFSNRRHGDPIAIDVTLSPTSRADLLN